MESVLDEEDLAAVSAFNAEGFVPQQLELECDESQCSRDASQLPSAACGHVQRGPGTVLHANDMFCDSVLKFIVTCISENDMFCVASTSTRFHAAARSLFPQGFRTSSAGWQNGSE